MTVDQIIQEARQLPEEQLLELVDRLAEGLNLSPTIEDSWRAETRRRIAAIQNGQIEGIPGPQVAARIRKIVGR